MKYDFSEYPICDADMWVYLWLSDYINRVFDKYGKLVFADVVEQEILEWENGDNKYKDIAHFFKACKVEEQVIVINHEEHIEAGDRLILEQALMDLDFKHGLRNSPREKDKGEFVSALYADHFNIPFMKTNDNSFQDGGRGKKEFPELRIKNWYSLVEEFSVDQDEKIKIRRLIDEEQKIMKRKHETYKVEKKKEDLLQAFADKFNGKRL
ncbi:hypothetical protein [Rossellomorea aquimaris]|uniref:PIN domain-containing protein n=1 Tax=Rossellomorea aquimaris TaxID=189382 RepID=A0A5D4TQV3_9BACI|nr:hypothetical protein [Rossellomorea aquimaris]TYS76584.1 hypothetical protein FZC80_14870 [Rossellomorea aquimaris]